MKLYRNLTILFTLTLFIYLFYRAATLSLTHDEAYTFDTFVELDRFGLISFFIPSSNNHVLNTIGMFVGNLISPGSELLLRLPNVLSFLIYSFAIYQISKNFKQKILGTALIIISLLNPLALEFFSLARGYGISLSLIALSIHLAIKYQSNKSNKNLLILLIASSLSVIANYSFIFFYLSLQFIILISIALDFKLQILKLIDNIKGLNLIAEFRTRLNFKIKLFISYNLIFLALVSIPILFMKFRNDLYFGGDNNFFSDTMLSLMTDSAYRLSHANVFATITGIAISIAIILNLALLLNKIHKTNKFNLDLETVSILVPSIMIILSMILHLVIGLKFSISRTALVYYPLFALNIILFVQNAQNLKAISSNVKNVVISISLLLINITVILNFLVVLPETLNKTLEWKYDADTKQAIREINNMYLKDESRLAVSWLLQPSAVFYQKKYKLENNVFERNENIINEDYEYFLLTPEDFNEFSNKYGYEIVKTYRVSENVLVKKI